MSYLRVIPRDLFNEAKLLKCLGKLVIESEHHNMEIGYNDEPFNVCQRESDGGLFVSNIDLVINGMEVFLYSPYNNKRNWPLLAEFGDEKIEVFDENGELTGEFLSI